MKKRRPKQHGSLLNYKHYHKILLFQNNFCWVVLVHCTNCSVGNDDVPYIYIGLMLRNMSHDQRQLVPRSFCVLEKDGLNNVHRGPGDLVPVDCGAEAADCLAAGWALGKETGRWAPAGGETGRQGNSDDQLLWWRSRWPGTQVTWSVQLTKEVVDFCVLNGKLPWSFNSMYYKPQNNYIIATGHEIWRGRCVLES